MNYVTGVVMQFTTKDAQEVLIKARGKFIARAVDIAEVACKRFLEGQVGVKDIKIDSEEFEKFVLTSALLRSKLYMCDFQVEMAV